MDPNEFIGRCILIDALKPRLLIVDDNPGSRLALETLLEKEYSVDLAASGEAALYQASKKTYAVILESWLCSWRRLNRAPRPGSGLWQRLP